MKVAPGSALRGVRGDTVGTTSDFEIKHGAQC